MDGKMKRFPKTKGTQQAEGALCSTSRWKCQESLILERPKNLTPEFLVSLIVKNKVLERHQGLKIQTNLEVPNRRTQQR